MSSFVKSAVATTRFVLCRARRFVNRMASVPAAPIPKVVVFYDAENISCKHYDKVIRYANSIGHVMAVRVYGPVELLAKTTWKSIAKKTVAELIVCNGKVSGKNSVDIRIVVDAISLLDLGEYTDFVIASNDSDYTPLAKQIRLKGCFVHRVGHGGQAKDAGAFNTWTNLGSEGPDPELRSKLIRAVKDSTAKDGWAKMSSVGLYLKSRYGENHEDYGYKTLAKLLGSFSDFEIVKSDGSTGSRVRLKPVCV